ncbi:unnamed protein product, partial [Ceratitis capitata]
ARRLGGLLKSLSRRSTAAEMAQVCQFLSSSRVNTKPLTATSRTIKETTHSISFWRNKWTESKESLTTSNIGFSVPHLNMELISEP